jgi:hypothetical protein
MPMYLFLCGLFSDAGSSLNYFVSGVTGGLMANE